MKKRILFSILTLFIITSLACQAVTNLVGVDEPEVTDETAPVLVKVPTIQPTPTEKAEMPALPSGGWIAIAKEKNIWLIRPDGSGLTQVTDLPKSSEAEIWDVQWSPDGQNLAVVYNRDLYLVNTQSFSQVLLVRKTGGDIDWSPEGDQILYDSYQVDPYVPWKNDGLWVVDIKTGKTKRIVRPTQKIEGMINPQWSPDGNFILFQISCIEVCPYGVADLELGGAVALPLRHMAGGWGHQCKWAPDESVITCVQTSPNTIATFIPRGRILEEIPLSINDILSFQWMPDRESLLIGYLLDDKERMDILNLEDGSLSPFSTGIPVEWSPTGEWLIAVEERSYPTENLLIVDLKTGTPQPLTETASGIVAWYPTMADMSGIANAPSPIPEVDNSSVDTEGEECMELTVTLLDTPKGDYYQICAEYTEYYEVGPLEKGSYAIGPNKKFFVYISNSGLVYAHRIGTTGMKQIGDISSLAIIAMNKNPDLDFQFNGDHPYTVQVYENILKQFSDAMSIPRYITSPN